MLMKSLPATHGSASPEASRRTSPMLIFPAIDLMGGQVVRLRQGRADEKTIYSDDPVGMAQRWADEGGDYLHIIDLDAAFTGEQRLHDLAEDTLEVFAGVAEQFGIYAGTYGLASVWMTHPHIQVIVIGEGPQADALYAAALAPFALNKIVLRVKDPASVKSSLPPALAETIAEAPGVQAGRTLALLCSGFTCQPPIESADDLTQALRDAIVHRQ